MIRIQLNEQEKDKKTEEKWIYIEYMKYFTTAEHSTEAAVLVKLFSTLESK